MWSTFIICIYMCIPTMHYYLIYKYIYLHRTLLTLMLAAWVGPETIICPICEVTAGLTKLRRDPEGGTTSLEADQAPSLEQLLWAHCKTLQWGNWGSHHIVFTTVLLRKRTHGLQWSLKWNHILKLILITWVQWTRNGNAEIFPPSCMSSLMASLSREWWQSVYILASLIINNKHKNKVNLEPEL